MNVMRHFVHTVRPYYDAVIAAVEGHALFLAKLTQVN